MILFRRAANELEVLLVHPGGPVWAKRDQGAWSIPKGEVLQAEDLLAAAQREFTEELGTTLKGTFLPLGSITQKGGKVVHAWALEGDLDTTAIRSNAFTMEWPPRSGREQEFPEIDRAAFFSIEAAKQMVNPAQVALLERLQETLR